MILSILFVSLLPVANASTLMSRGPAGCSVTDVSPNATACSDGAISVLFTAVPGSGGMASDHGLTILSQHPDGDLFGVYDWVLASRISRDTRDAPTDIGLSVNRFRDSGRWRLNRDSLQEYDQAMLVLRTRASMAAYLFERIQDLAGGRYTTSAFRRPRHEDPKLRELSIFVRQSVAPVPLPGPVWMMLTGLFGLIGWHRVARLRGKHIESAVDKSIAKHKALNLS